MPARRTARPRPSAAPPATSPAAAVEVRATNSFASVPLASIPRRFVALLIDGLLLGVVSALLTLVMPDGLASVLTLGVGVYYHVHFLSTVGATPGKSAMRVRVVHEDGRLLTQGEALVRYIGSMLSALALGLGYAWALFDDRKRTWHDRMANSLVVEG